MSRYYSIEITDPTTDKVYRTYTSFPNGKTDPGALNVEFDIPVAPWATPSQAGAYVRVWGISLKDISQATDLNGKAVKVFAGMQKGLPLANPAQAGLIVQGSIKEAYGNWQGTTQTLDLILGPESGSAAAPKNIVLNWPAGTALGTAIGNTLSTAFPGFKQDIKVSPKLVLAHDEVGFYQSLSQFAIWVKGVSQDIVGGNYAGVDIMLKEKAFTVYDGTSSKSPRAISFMDLIGQPTWTGPQQMQFRCPIRADIQIGDYVSLPKTQVTTSGDSLSQFRNSSAFQGTFQVQTIRHVGAFRVPDASSWISIFDAYPAAA